MKIVALDDEALMLEHLCECIREAEPEAEVEPFRRASEVLAYVKQEKVDVAFLDIQMRGMLGTELAKELKAIAPRINIIFVTGFREYQGEAFEMHASGYLVKPITAGKVREELDNLRFPIAPPVRNRVRFQCFGNFEVFVEGKKKISTRKLNCEEIQNKNKLNFIHTHISLWGNCSFHGQ